MARPLPLILLLLTACAERRQLEIDAGAGDLVITAAVDELGKVTEVRMTGGDELTVLPFEEGAVVAFVLPAGSLVDETGAVVTRPELSVGSGVTSSCGRCLAPGVRSPKILLPGERCPVPEFAQAELFGAVHLQETSSLPSHDEQVEWVRRQIQLGVPGPCACEPPAVAPPPDLDVCPLLPEAAPILVDEVSVAADGSVLAANEGFAIRVAPDGARFETRFAPAFSAILAVARLPDGTNLVAAETPRLGRRVRLFRLYDDAMRPIDATGLPELDPRAVGRLRGADFHIIGEQSSVFDETYPAVFACDIVGTGAFSCRAEEMVHEQRCRTVVEQALQRVVTTSSGVDVAATDKTHFYLRPPGGDRWYCDADSEAPSPFGVSDPGTLEALGDVAVLGDRLFACALFDQDGEDVIGVLTGMVPVLTATEAAVDRAYGFDFTVVPLDDVGCGTFARDGDTLLLTSSRRSAAYRFDASGALVERYDATGSGEGRLLFDGLLPGPSHRIRSAGGVFVATSSNGAVYRGDGVSAFDPIYAPVPLQAYRALAGGGDYVAAFSEASPPITIRAERGTGCAGVQTESRPVDGLSTDGERAEAALATSDGRFVVTFAHPDRAAIRFVDLEAGRVDRELLLPELGGVRLTAGAELTPGRYVLVSDDGRVFELQDDLRPLEIVYSERTPTVPREPVAWQDVGAKNGVAWLAGSRHLGRVVAGSTTVEGFWLERAARGGFLDVSRDGLPVLDALSVRCPDDVVLAASERTFQSTLSNAHDENLVWWLVQDENGHSLEPFPGHDTAARTRPADSARGVAILEGLGAPTFLYDDGVIRRLGLERSVLPFNRVEAAARSGAVIVAGGPGGRLSVLIDR